MCCCSMSSISSLSAMSRASSPSLFTAARLHPCSIKYLKLRNELFHCPRIFTLSLIVLTLRWIWNRRRRSRVAVSSLRCRLDLYPRLAPREIPPCPDRRLCMPVWDKQKRKFVNDSVIASVVEIKMPCHSAWRLGCFFPLPPSGREMSMNHRHHHYFIGEQRGSIQPRIICYLIREVPRSRRSADFSQKNKPSVTTPTRRMDTDITRSLWLV